MDTSFFLQSMVNHKRKVMKKYFLVNSKSNNPILEWRVLFDLLCIFTSPSQIRKIKSLEKK